MKVKVIKTKGFTLIELIAAMSMTSILMLAVYYVLTSGFYNYTDGQRKERVVNSNKIVMTLLSAELKNSNKYEINPLYVIKDEHGATMDMSATSTTYKIPIVYIEGSTYRRYMYVIKKAGTKAVGGIDIPVGELHKLIFDEQLMKGYMPIDISTIAPHHVISVLLTDEEKNKYFDASNSQNIVSASNLVNNGSDMTLEYDIAHAKMAFEPLGQNCYLLAQKLGATGLTDPYYRIKMVEQNVTTFTVISNGDIKISENIESIDLKSQGYECKISIKAVDINHEEQLNSSTTILNYRGVS